MYELSLMHCFMVLYNCWTLHDGRTYLIDEWHLRDTRFTADKSKSNHFQLSV